MRIFIVTVFYFFLSHTSVWAQSLQDAAAKVDPAVGRVITARGFGSGFAVGYAANGKDIYFITNNHVIDGADKVSVRFGKDQKVFVYKAKIVNRSRELDLAILLLTVPEDIGHKIQVVPIAVEAPPKGLDVFAVGFPGASDNLVSEASSPDSMETTLTRGSISKISTGPWHGGTASQNIEIISHTASINPGNSGGPLFDFCGRVVGVNTAFDKRNNNVYLSSSSTVTSGFLGSTDTPFNKATGECNPNGFNLRAIAPWVISAFVLAGLGLIGYFLFAPKLDGKQQSKIRAGRGAKSGAKASLYLHVTGKDGQKEKYSLTSSQLNSGVTIGRSSNCGVQIDAQKISRNHARIRLENRKLSIEDLGSSNGTTVNGNKLSANKPEQINSNSQIILGDSRLSIHRSK